MLPLPTFIVYDCGSIVLLRDMLIWSEKQYPENVLKDMTCNLRFAQSTQENGLKCPLAINDKRNDDTCQ